MSAQRKIKSARIVHCFPREGDTCGCCGQIITTAYKDLDLKKFIGGCCVVELAAAENLLVNGAGFQVPSDELIERHS